MKITEALAELKTIVKRITKKQESVMRYFARQGNVVDPLADEGGSQKFVTEQRQAIRDLQTRIIWIRTAIQKANLGNELKIGKTTRSVAEWLVWRREVAAMEKHACNSLQMGLDKVRKEVHDRKMKMVEGAQTQDSNVVIVYIKEVELAAEAESLEETLGTLDGKLSLFNAQTDIDVAEAT